MEHPFVVSPTRSVNAIAVCFPQRSVCVPDGSSILVRREVNAHPEQKTENLRSGRRCNEGRGWSRSHLLLSSSIQHHDARDISIPSPRQNNDKQPGGRASAGPSGELGVMYRMATEVLVVLPHLPASFRELQPVDVLPVGGSGEGISQITFIS